MSDPRPHHIPDGFPFIDGELHIAGRAATRWVEDYGSPLFIYDCALMSKRVAELRAALPPGLKIHYAIKANPHPGVVQHFAGLCDGVDIASAGELRIALAAGAREISFAGPGKTNAELAEALDAAIVITLESEGEASRLAELASRSGRQARVAIRINPEFELRGAGMRMGGRPQPFGIDAGRVPALLAALPSMPLKLEGLHVYAGSQSLSADGLAQAQAQTLALLQGLLPLCPTSLRFLNIGGGFGIPYFPGDMPLDLKRVGENLAGALDQYRSQFNGLEIILELGRYLVGEAGVYLTRIVDRKISQGETFLVTDGGLHHQLAASGNFGQVLRRNYPVTIARQRPGQLSEKVTVTGCLCTPLDRLAERITLPLAQPGDILAIYQAGAYGLSASPSGFLGHPLPAEVLVQELKMNENPV